MKAPCESCPDHCGRCAWDHSQTQRVQSAQLITIRTPEAYGCVRSAAVVVDTELKRPFMQIGEVLYPLSEQFGGVIGGTILERDISAAMAA